MTDLVHGAAITQERATRCRVVLDTSVLIADPTSLWGYPGTDIVIPLVVIEELDSLKTRMDDVGRSARTALRSIEDLRIAAGGSLAAPVPIDPRPGHVVSDGSADHATLRIEVNGVQRHRLVEFGLDPDKADNRIIGAALGQSVEASVQVVSNDAALRIKAAHLGLTAIEHRPSGSSPDARPTGWTTIPVPGDVVDRIYNDASLPATEVPESATVSENGFVVLRAGSQSALARRRGERFGLLGSNPVDAWGLRPRSKEQRFALELLLDPDVSVVALDGRAGTGKTILAVAAALEQVVEQRRYERVAIYRPLVPVGRADVGFLPGGLDEKLDPWMAAIHDAIVALTERRSHHDARQLIDELTDRGTLSLESVTFLRGRSLHRQITIVDEAQNLEPTTLKTILTRVGEGTKIIFTGDTSQIDAPYMGETNNALAVLIGAFSGQECFGHIRLVSCERSAVASLAAELL
ncbi:MAG: PhoH family protein [Acidimicrobiia bacterium]